jgi:glycosyltransferase involved in cell wall biosynthesis
MTHNKKIDLSIVIPTYNRPNFLLECINSILNQNTRHNFEIIVICDGTDSRIDKLMLKFKKLKNIKYFVQKKLGPAAARNVGIKHSRAKIITFLDDDCIVNKNWIENILLAHKKHPNINHAIAGRLDPVTNCLVSEFSKGLESRASADNSTIFYPSMVNNVSYKRETLNKIKGFDESFKNASGEDVEYNYRLYNKNIRTIYVENILIKHHYPEKIVPMLKQQFRFGTTRPMLMIKTNDYPFKKKPYWLYIIKRIATPFADPFLRLRYALTKKKKYAIVYLFIGYLHQIAYWSGFLYSILKKNQ